MAAAEAARCAIVIGVGSGLGGAVARRFARSGLPVGCISRSDKSVRPVVDAIEAAGGTAHGVLADATDADSLQAAIKEVIEKLGAPCSLVYNASGGGGFSFPPPSLLDTDVSKLRTVFDSGFFGAVTATQAVIPAMLESGGGSILYTGATGSLRGGAKFLWLAGPKFALRALSQSVAREFGPKGIHAAHIIVDGMIGEADGRMNPDDIADTYFHVHSQPKSVWTQELDVRPSTEKF